MKKRDKEAFEERQRKRLLRNKKQREKERKKAGEREGDERERERRGRMEDDEMERESQRERRDIERDRERFRRRVVNGEKGANRSLNRRVLSIEEEGVGERGENYTNIGRGGGTGRQLLQFQGLSFIIY